MSASLIRYGDGMRVNANRSGAIPSIDRDDVVAAIRRGLLRGMSDIQIALYAGVCDKTVFRYRKAHGIPNVYKRGAL